MQQGSVLIIAWYFPPDGGAGSQRPASFARELPRLGWDTTVLTRGEQHDRGRWELSDDSLLPSIGKEADVVRVREEGPIPGLPRSFERVITRRAGPLCERALQIAVEKRPDVILLTMSPFCLASLVEPLRAQTDARIVVDLRDPWALDYWPDYSTPSRFRYQHRLMYQTLSKVDGIVMNTQAARKDLFKSFPQLLKLGFQDRVAVVTNGYSKADFSNGEAVKPSRERLQIMHTGTFHCEYLYPDNSLKGRLRSALKRARGDIDRRGRTPYFILEAASLLKEHEPSVFEDLTFEFNGHVDELLERCVTESGIADKVSLPGYAPHEKAVQSMCSAGALFLPGAGFPAGVEDLIIPGKTYEYLASGRPIIAAIPAGDARRLLAQAGGDYPCEPCSAESIASALKQLHRDWKAGRCDDLLKQRGPILAAHERATLATALASFLKKVKQIG